LAGWLKDWKRLRIDVANSLMDRRSSLLTFGLWSGFHNELTGLSPPYLVRGKSEAAVLEKLIATSLQKEKQDAVLKR